MSLALVFKASSVKGAFFWRFFLNNYVKVYASKYKAHFR